VEQLLDDMERAGMHCHFRKVAVMGCPVNGPGEARDADLGIAGSRNGKVILFRSGAVQGTFDAEEGFALFKKQLLENSEERGK
jgi:(E)-4-hydroxy-3-methylbut-2-enyl-diphosphate synthase